MENPSIYAVFERMWQHILTKLNSFVLTETFNDHIGNENNPNPHKITKDLVGLDQVDNTSDIDKPISTATQTALDEKAGLDHSHWSNEIIFMDGLPVECGGTGYATIEDTEYTRPRYRASALVSYEPTLTPGYHTNGVIYWVYE